MARLTLEQFFVKTERCGQCLDCIHVGKQREKAMRWFGVNPRGFKQINDRRKALHDFDLAMAYYPCEETR